MTRSHLMTACALTLHLASAGFAAAQDLPPGLTSARLLPGWTDAQGNRIAALELVLQPGWKTYWRSPGDSGLPPQFDWTASGNLADVTLHWPAPEAIASGPSVSMGYHDRLVLPLTAVPRDPAKPVKLSASVDLGLCERICVPGHLVLAAPAAGSRPDPVIQASLDAVPVTDPRRPVCRVSQIADGMQVSVTLPDPGTLMAAIELPDQPDIWVSSTQIEGQTATAEFVPASAKPFDLATGTLQITVIGPDGASQMSGCDPRDRTP